MTLDHTTFGDSPAEITLAKILNELGDSRATTCVSRILTQLNRRVKLLMKIEDKATKRFLYTLLRSYAFERVDKTPILQENLKLTTYMKNCITKRLRQYLLA